jgi:hypothetical protein|tara:strand:+ start:253 stop:1356 length:1104 start_codon:yes stop_codon:yes gene_type:complete
MKYLLTTLLISLLYHFSYSQCNNRYQAEIYSSVNITTVNYSDVYSDNFHEMDIYTADGDTAINRPLIIFHHGGSYYQGSKESQGCIDFCTVFAKKGYVAVSANYRLVSLLNIVSFLSNHSEQYEEVLKATADMKSAIRHFKKDFSNGNTYGIDTNAIFIGGISSGGVTAIHSAYIDNITDLPTSPINVQNIANALGGLDGDAGNDGYSSSINGIINFAGGIHQLNWIDTNDEPIFSAQGDNDVIVNYNCGPGLNNPSVLDLCGLGEIHPICDSLGVVNQALTFNNADHFWVVGNSQPEFLQAIDSATSFLYQLLPCNQTTNITELLPNKRKLIRITNLLGKNIQEKYNSPMFYIYDDGYVERKIILK